MNGMDLVEALRLVGPLVGDPAIDRVRNAAMVVVYREIEKQKRHLTATDAHREEAAQAAALKLMRMRVPQHEAPMSESGARGYIATTLRNAYLDLYRKEAPIVGTGPRAEPVRAKFVSAGTDEHEVDLGRLVVDDETPESILDEREQAARRAGRPPLERLRAIVLDEIAPRVAAELQGKVRTDFERTIAEIRSIKRGERTVADAIAAELGQAPDDTPIKARNRYYARKSRACRRLHEHLLASRDAGRMSAAQAELLRRVIDEAIKD